MDEIILEFFKTLADVERIRIAALLAEEALTVEQIAARLDLRPVEVPRHLARLEKIGLLAQAGAQYRLDRKALERLAREQLAHLRAQVQEHSNDEDADEYDRKVVKNYSLPDGRLKEIPLQDKKLLAVLRHVVQVFEPGIRYTEKEVNAALARFHPDTAFLRRALVDRQMIAREVNGTAYWRA